MRKDWTETTLGDIAKFVRGPFGGSLKKEIFVQSGFAVYEQQHAIYGDFVNFRYFVNKEKFDEMKRFSVSTGDLLMSCSGTVGKVSLVPPGAPVGIINQALLKISTRSQVSSAFLLYWTQSEIFHLLIQENSGGAVQQNVASVKLLKDIRITLPPIDEQKRIVDVVSSVDAYIDALQQQANSARRARSAVSHELLTAGGDGWTETTIGKEASINPKESALALDAPFVPMDAVKVGKRFVDYFEPRGERSGARAKSGDVLFARITPCLENGKVAQIQDGVGVCGGSTEFIVLRGTETINSDFIYFWATLGSTRDLAAGLMTGTTGRQRLSANDLGEIVLNLPPLAEQKRIVEIVSSMDDVIQSTEQAVTDATNLRSGLLSDLLSGEHDIPATYDKFLKAA